jgi:riboflavin kinase/FMN adenylyltransferase
MIRLDHRQLIPDELHGAILALGNFDGFHQGHQAVVGTAIDWARAEGRPAVVATFDPHPMRFFHPDTEPFRLTTLDQRQELFAGAGADAMLVIHFDASIAGMSAEHWVQDIIHSHLQTAGVVTGQDFTFGKGRSGNAQSLSQLGAAFGIRTRPVEPVHDLYGPISSSRIRDAIREGDCDTAVWLLTRPYAIRGVVEHGDKVGRTIGFPTANLQMGSYLLADGRVLKGAANVGIRPTFNPPKELLEPYFFDFHGDLYGEEIEVEFHHFLRPEQKFGSLEALTTQMQLDCEKARKLLR